MKERFEKDGRRISLMPSSARSLSGRCETRGCSHQAWRSRGISEGRQTHHRRGRGQRIYLLLAGSVAVVKGNEINTRKAGQHVGEMAAIEPSQKRSATIVAHDTVVALKVKSADFSSIGKEFPQIWLPIARELRGDCFSATI